MICTHQLVKGLYPITYEYRYNSNNGKTNDGILLEIFVSVSACVIRCHRPL